MMNNFKSSNSRTKGFTSRPQEQHGEGGEMSSLRFPTPSILSNRMGISFLLGLGVLGLIAYGGHQASSSQYNGDSVVSLESRLERQERTLDSDATQVEVEVSSQELLTQEKSFIQQPFASLSTVKQEQPKLPRTSTQDGDGDGALSETEVVLASPNQRSQGTSHSTLTIAPITVPNEAIERSIHDAVPGMMACASDTDANHTDANDTNVLSSTHEFAMEQRYLYHTVDLDGDRREEMVVSLLGPMTCGTGGCTRLILQASSDHSSASDAPYQMVSKVTLVNGAMVVSDRTTSGWNDLLVKVEGGGAQPGYRRLQFDGRTYPSNPSLESMVEQGDEQQGTLLVMDESTAQDSAPLLSAPPCDR